MVDEACRLKPEGDENRSRGQTLFDWLNCSKRPDVTAVRDLMEKWLPAYPQDARSHLATRLRSRSDEQFYAAFFELYLFMLMQKIGFGVVLPSLGQQGQRTEDFKVMREDRLIFRLEAKYIGQETKYARQDRFQRDIEEAISNLSCGPVWFAVSLRDDFTGQPSAKKVARKFEQWVAEQSNAIQQAVRSHTIDLESLTLRIREAGAVIEIRPLCAKRPDRSNVGPIASWSTGARWMQTDGKLRKALSSKSTRYGVMNSPFVLAGGLYEIVDNIDINNALFGDEVFRLHFAGRDSVPEAIPSRKPNGLWLGPRGPRNTRVSAVLIVNEFFPWSIVSRPPIVFHNPWAQHPLSIEALPLTQMVVNRRTGCFEIIRGIEMSSLLGLPVGWPRGRS